MSEQHTPGPWVFEPGPQGEPGMTDAAFIIAGPGEAGEVVATVLAPVQPGAPDANAALIAAAPELLEALRGLLAYYTGGRLNHPAHLAAEAAVAKAEGR